MAGAGFKDFQAGDILTAADVDNYLMQQTVMVFDDSSARDTALTGVVAEGMFSYLKSDDTLYQFNGSVWEVAGSPEWLTNYPQNTPELAATSSGQVLMTTGSLATPVWQPMPTVNYIINGAFDIWQRGTSFGNVAAYTADRMRYSPSTATAAITQQTFAAGDVEAVGFGDAANYWRATFSAFSGTPRIEHPVENVKTLAGQQVTVSAWVRVGSAASMRFVVSQAFGTGGSSDVVQVSSFSATTSWQRFSATFTLGSMSGKTIGANSHLLVRIDALANPTTLDVWGVQLEAGSIATPFKRHAPSLQGELAACQRYYIRYAAELANYYIGGRGNASSTTNVVMQYPTMVEMRTKPSSIDFSALQVYDEVSAIPVSTATVAALANTKLLQAALTCSGATQYRTYTTVSQGGSVGFIGFSAEL